MKTTLQLVILLISIFLSISLKAQGPVNAIKLDGNDDYIECSNNNRGITSSITVEAWVKTSSYVYHWVVGKYDREAQGGYHLIIKDGKAAFAGRDGSGIYRISGYSSILVNDNNWHHLTGVCNNGIWQIYVDGVLHGEFNSGYTFTNLTSTSLLAIGKDFLANNENYNGQVDEIRIWKRALTQSEIRQNMCQKVSPVSTDLVAYYNFNEGTGSSVQDLSPTKINGTFRNMNSGTVWVVSGAPIGDKSAYLYPTTWIGQQLNMAGIYGNQLSITSAAHDLKGMHIYSVGSEPAPKTGIAKPEQVKEYFGIFKVGSISATYSVESNQADVVCSKVLYRRGDNTASSWSKIAEAIFPLNPVYSSNVGQGEFALNSSISGSSTIQGNTFFCSGSNTTLSVTTNGSVLWSTGETTKSITVSTAGTYGVTVVENGCTLTNQVTVNEVSVPIVNLGADRLLCQGETALLSAPSGPYTYKWNDGSSASTLNVTIAGNYSVEVTNASGCTSIDNINIQVVPKPIIGLSPAYQICPGEQVMLDATLTNASYKWSTGATTPILSTNVPGAYWVDVTSNGCTFRYQTTVSLNALPAFKIDGPSQICELGAVTLRVPAVGAIKWSTGATTPSITVFKGGTYSVQTVINGCTLTDEVTLTVLPMTNFTLGNHRTICKGEKITLTAPDNMKSYRWTTGATKSTIEVTAGGIYGVEVTNISGCIFYTEVIISEKKEPIIMLPSALNACYGEVVTLDATTEDAAYLWSTGQTSASINVVAPSELSVKIIVDGCEYERQIKVISDECPIIPNIITPNNDGRNDTFVLKGLNTDNIDVEIFNRWGKSIYKSNGSYQNNWSTTGAGTYYYHIKSRQTQKDYKGWVEVVK